MVRNLYHITKQTLMYDLQLDPLVSVLELYDIVSPNVRNKMELSNLYLKMNTNVEEVSAVENDKYCLVR